MDSAQEVADAADRVAHVMGLQHLVGHKLVNRVHWFISHEAGKSASCVSGLLLGYRIVFAAQCAVQASQVGAFLVVGLDTFLAELLAEKIGNIGERHGVGAVGVFAYEVRQAEHFSGYYHQQ